MLNVLLEISREITPERLKWDWKVVFYAELLSENQMINSNKNCFQLDQLRAALDENHLELVNRKCIIFHQEDHKTTCSFGDQAKTVRAWLGSSNASAEFIIHRTIRCPFICQLKIILMEKIPIPWKTLKVTWTSTLLKKIKSFGKTELCSCLKNRRK